MTSARRAVCKKDMTPAAVNIAADYGVGQCFMPKSSGTVDGSVIFSVLDLSPRRDHLVALNADLTISQSKAYSRGGNSQGNSGLLKTGGRYYSLITQNSEVLVFEVDSALNPVGNYFSVTPQSSEFPYVTLLFGNGTNVFLQSIGDSIIPEIVKFDLDLTLIGKAKYSDRFRSITAIPRGCLGADGFWYHMFPGNVPPNIVKAIKYDVSTLTEVGKAYLDIGFSYRTTSTTRENGGFIYNAFIDVNVAGGLDVCVCRMNTGLTDYVFSVSEGNSLLDVDQIALDLAIMDNGNVAAAFYRKPDGAAYRLQIVLYDSALNVISQFQDINLVQIAGAALERNGSSAVLAIQRATGNTVMEMFSFGESNFPTPVAATCNTAYQWENTSLTFSRRTGSLVQQTPGAQTSFSNDSTGTVTAFAGQTQNYNCEF